MWCWNRTERMLAVVAAAGLAVGSANAGVVVVSSDGNSDASSSDLLQTQFGSVVESILDGYSAPEPTLRDGVGTALAVRANNGDWIRYLFDVSVNKRGYRIDYIDLFFGHWGTGRNQLQDLDVHYATVESPGDFSNVILTGGATEIMLGYIAPGFNGGRARVVDDAGIALATGVAGIEITFNTVQNSWSTLAEIDAVGDLAVPLPPPGTVLTVR